MKYLLLGNAGIEAAQLGTVLRHFDADVVMAVDGGLRHLEAIGRRADILLGDLDSSTSFSNARKVVFNPDQSNTDFDKAIAHCLQCPQQPSHILALGFSGGRLDHSLAILSQLAHIPGHINTVVLDRYQTLRLCRGEVAMPVKPGANVAILPLVETFFESSQGLQWPLDGLTLSLLGSLSVANRASASTLRLKPRGQNPYVVTSAPESWYDWLLLPRETPPAPPGVEQGA